jgi:hypothetical protein
MPLINPMALDMLIVNGVQRLISSLLWTSNGFIQESTSIYFVRRNSKAIKIGQAEVVVICLIQISFTSTETTDVIVFVQTKR